MHKQQVPDIEEDFPSERMPDEPMPPMPEDLAEPAAKARPAKEPARKRVKQKQGPASGNDKGRREAQRIGKRKLAAGMNLFRVNLAAKTPLAHPTLEIEAKTEEEAKASFCRQNGISDSSCPWSIVRIA